MKQHILHIVLSIVLLFSPSVVWGQEEWNGESSGTYKLSKNFHLNQVVKVSNETLTIESDETGQHTITTSAAQFFDVRLGGKLVIKGAEGSEIILDGGAVFDGDRPYKKDDFDNYEFAGNKRHKMEEALYSDLGTIEIEYVIIQNVDAANNFSDSDNNGGAILIQRGGGTTGTKGNIGSTIIKKCTIRNCASRHGSAIHIANQKKQQTVDDIEAENGAVRVEDSVIEFCYASGVDTQTGANSLDQIKNANNPEGGTIRTNGTAVSNLYLTRTTIRNNYSGGYGGGLYWNGKGTPETKCVIEGCTFQGNVAYRKGGAMMLETTFEFSNAGFTSIKENKALGRIEGEKGTGGGIVVASYDGKSIPKEDDNEYSFTYNLSDKLSITENVAEEGAGISFDFEKFELTNSWSSNENVINIEVNFNGATISKNNATDGNGGGLRLYNNTAGNTSHATVNITFNLNSGTLSENRAQGNGAGIYTYHADITTTPNNTGKLTMDENEAAENGGGIYVEGGQSINLGTNSMTSNSASNGGAIYIASENTESPVSVILGETNLTKNIAVSNGGAIYVAGGDITLGTATMSENEATNGGAISLSNGIFNFGDESKITGNTAYQNGGGLYVTNTTSSEVTIECYGGAFTSNSAINNGGGIYLSGPIILNFAANVQSNTAKDGGGIYIDGGAEMNFGNGLIVGNEAGNKDGKTGYGGGVYLKKGTLAFTSSEGFGIYNNAAGYAAADIYTTGQETVINLPNVKNMNLKGFDVPGSELYWVQDNPDNRYEDALFNLETDIESMILSFGNTENYKEITGEYCLDLGYDLVFVGLKTDFSEVTNPLNDAVIIKIYYPDKEYMTDKSKATLYRTVLVGSSGQQRVGLPTGYWYFEVHNPWNYEYGNEITFGNSVLRTSNSNSTMSDINVDDAKGLFNRTTLKNNGEMVVFKYVKNNKSNIIGASKNLVNKMVPK